MATRLDRFEADSEWTKASPGTLLARRERRQPRQVPEPQWVAEDRLSPLWVQGTPGRAVGGLVCSSAILPPPSRYAVRVAHEDSGSSELVAYVMGDETQLEALDGAEVVVDGTVWWLRGASAPVVEAQSLRRIR